MSIPVNNTVKATITTTSNTTVTSSSSSTFASTSAALDDRSLTSHFTGDSDISAGLAAYPSNTGIAAREMSAMDAPQSCRDKYKEILSCQLNEMSESKAYRYEISRYRLLPEERICDREKFRELIDTVTHSELHAELCLAVWHGEKEKVLDLLKVIDTNETDALGQTALHLAVRRGNIDIVKLLFEAGVDIDKQNKLGQTALFLAAQAGHVAIAQFLLDQDAGLTTVQADSEDIAGIIPELGDYDPWIAAIRSDNIGMFNLFLALGFDVDDIEEEGQQLKALHLAARYGSTNIIRYLLEGRRDLAGEIVPIDINATCNMAGLREATALHFAAAYNQPDVIRLLIGKGAYVDQPDELLNSALYYAALEGEECTRLLLDAGANPNGVDNRRYIQIYRPVNEAIRACNPEVVILFIERGAAINDHRLKAKSPLEGLTEFYDIKKHYGKIELKPHDSEKVKLMIKLLLDSGVTVTGFALNDFLAYEGDEYHDLLTTDYLLKGVDFKRFTLPGVNRINIPLIQCLVRECPLSSIRQVFSQVPPDEMNEFINKEGEERGLHGPILCTFILRFHFEGYRIDNLELFHLLIDHGAKLDVVNEQGESLLTCLSKYSRDTDIQDRNEQLRYMVDYLISVNAVSADEMVAEGLVNVEPVTQLRFAVHHYNEKMVACFLQHGSNINELDEHGNTLLHSMAIRKGAGLNANMLETLRVLLGRLIKNPSLNNNGFTPLSILVERYLRVPGFRLDSSLEEAVELLLRTGDNCSYHLFSADQDAFEKQCKELLQGHIQYELREEHGRSDQARQALATIEDPCATLLKKLSSLLGLFFDGEKLKEMTDVLHQNINFAPPLKALCLDAVRSNLPDQIPESMKKRFESLLPLPNFDGLLVMEMLRKDILAYVSDKKSSKG